MSRNIQFACSLGNLPTIEEKMKKLADAASLYPDIQLVIPYKTAYEALGALIIVQIVSSVKYEVCIYKFKENLAECCYKNNYQGKWKQVQEILELNPNNLIDIIEYINQHYSIEDIYGNLLPLLRKQAKLLKIQPRTSNRSRVRKSQRKRGYNDKGTYRFPHEFHQCWRFTGENPKRIDRRQQISPPRRPNNWWRTE